MNIELKNKIKEECLNIVESFMQDLNQRLDVKGSFEAKGVKLILNEYIADLIGKSDKAKKSKELNKIIKNHNKLVETLNSVIRKKLFLKSDNFVVLVNGQEQRPGGSMDPETRELQIKAYETTIAQMRKEVDESETLINTMKTEIRRMVA